MGEPTACPRGDDSTSPQRALQPLYSQPPYGCPSCCAENLLEDGVYLPRNVPAIPRRNKIKDREPVKVRYRTTGKLSGVYGKAIEPSHNPTGTKRHPAIIAPGVFVIFAKNGRGYSVGGG